MLENHFCINAVIPNEHLFSWTYTSSKWHPLSKKELTGKINKLANLFNLLNLKGHSLHIRGTLEYLLQGVSFDVIQSHGHWASSTFTLYLPKHTMILAPYLQASPVLEPFIRYMQPPVRWPNVVLSSFRVPLPARDLIFTFCIACSFCLSTAQPLFYICSCKPSCKSCLRSLGPVWTLKETWFNIQNSKFNSHMMLHRCYVSCHPRSCSCPCLVTTAPCMLISTMIWRCTWGSSLPWSYCRHCALLPASTFPSNHHPGTDHSTLPANLLYSPTYPP